MRNEVQISDSRALEAMQRFPEVMHRHLENGFFRGSLEFARLARRFAPKAFSTLTNSIHTERLGLMDYLIAPGVKYAPDVEDGRLPGKMPGTANGLMEWVKLRTGLAGRDLDRATFVIARAIGRKGIKAQPYMQPAFEQGQPAALAAVQRAVDAGIAELAQ